VTQAIKTVAETYKVNPMEGVLSHQMKRYIVDANKVIINKESIENKVDEFEFEEGEVYCIDILMSTGEGKSKESESRTTVYKRAVDQTYLLKLKAARDALNEINKKFPTFPFTLRYANEPYAI
jgi:methionine aminopeptidase